MSNDQEDDNYDDKHKAFLQALIAKSSFTFEEAQAILAAILTADSREETRTRPEEVTRETFQSYIDIVNDVVSDYDMEVRRTVHQITQTETFAIINLTSDPATQLATGFTPDEISFVKRVLDAMFETNNTLRNEIMAIQPIQATKLHKPLNRRETVNGETLGSTGTAITMLQAEKVLSSLVEQGWFEKSRKQFYSLSPRALMELRGWLEETYNEEEDDEEDSRGPRIKLCHVCKDIVTYGQRCANLTCHPRFHDNCADGFFRMQRAKICPSCKVDWTGQHFVGERAANNKATAKSRPSNSNQSQAESSTTQSRRSQPQEGISDEDDEA